MIAETAIVRVLLHCHNLYAVVTLMSYARQYIVAELGIAAHLLLILGHSDVALIDEQGISGRLELGLLPLIRLLGSPCLGAENLGLGVLHHAIDPRRNALSLSTVPVHAQLEEAAVLEGLVLNLNLPVSCLAHTLHGKLGALLPSVEVTHYVDVGSVGSPFAQYPTAVVLAVQSEIEIAVGKLREIAAWTCEMQLAGKHMLVSAVDGIGILSQVGVVLDQFQNGHFGWCFLLLCDLL